MQALVRDLRVVDSKKLVSYFLKHINGIAPYINQNGVGHQLIEEVKIYVLPPFHALWFNIVSEVVVHQSNGYYLGSLLEDLFSNKRRWSDVCLQVEEIHDVQLSVPVDVIDAEC